MRIPCTRLMPALVAVMLAAPAFADDFEARLGRVPVDSRTQSSVAGIGRATAELDGNRLEVAGAFEGMLGAATAANLHMSPAIGVRGPVIHTLDVSEQASGEIAGSVQLTAEQIAALRAGRLYIQVHSQSAPEGNLWGWLFLE